MNEVRFYIGQIVYLALPGAEFSGRIRSYTVDACGVMYEVMWNDGSTASCYADELKTELEYSSKE